jgi:hypothetical protein
MPCSQEDYDKMVPGTKIRVKGFKSEWSGEVEITDATYEIIDGNYVAKATDVTDKLGADNEYQQLGDVFCFLFQDLHTSFLFLVYADP